MNKLKLAGLGIAIHLVAACTRQLEINLIWSAFLLIYFIGGLISLKIQSKKWEPVLFFSFMAFELGFMLFIREGIHFGIHLLCYAIGIVGFLLARTTLKIYWKLLIVALVSVGMIYAATKFENSSDELPDQLRLSELNLTNYKRNPIVIKPMSGKLTYVELWFTTCGYCIEQMQDVELVKDKYTNKVDFYYVNMAKESEEEVQKFYTAFNFRIRNFYCERDLLTKLGCDTGPQTLVFNDKGECIYYKSGYLKTHLANTIEMVLDDLVENEN